MNPIIPNLPDFQSDGDQWRKIADALPMLIGYVDKEQRYLFSNKAYESVFLMSAHEILGKSMREIFGERGYQVIEPHILSALSGKNVTFEPGYLETRQGRRWFEVNYLPQFDTNGNVEGFVSFVIDITARKQTEEALRKSEQLYRNLIDAAEEGVWIIDAKALTTFVNPKICQMLGYTADEMLETSLFDYMDEEGRELAFTNTERRRQGIAEHHDFKFLRKDGSVLWTIVSTNPLLDEKGNYTGALGMLTDITERKRLEGVAEAAYQREVLVNQIGQALRGSLDPQEIQRIATEALGKALGLDRCYFHLFDIPHDVCWIEHDWHRSDLRSLSARYRISEIPRTLFSDLFQFGGTLQIEDIHTSYLKPETIAVLQQINLRSLLTVPYYDAGVLTAVLVMGTAERPRRWTLNETALGEAVAAQTRSAIESARLLELAQMQVQREALINKIGQIVLNTSDPDAVQTFAVESLGRMLGVDRCFIRFFDPVVQTARVGQDWHRDDLPSLAGDIAAEEYDRLTAEYFEIRDTMVTNDVIREANETMLLPGLQRLGLRSAIRVPVFDDGQLVASLGVGMADLPRVWTTHEILLVETVAAQTRSAVEAARSQRRERQIATTLQSAIQSVLPVSVPGLTVASYYKAALDESGIGGDFYDVFPLDAQITALVIGDVSGKGLSAAVQISVVRNMLRGVLYRREPLSQSLSELNGILTHHELLSGFVTLLVALYDASTQILTFISCGHEPGLIRRADGNRVEMLCGVNAPLGIDEGSIFQEQTIALSQNDILLFYTDGLSEAGPNRTELLGTAGIASLLESFPDKNAEALVQSVVASVEEYSLTGLSDDACMLAARVG